MKTKYPRTFHLPFSQGVTSDDKKLSSVEHFIGKEIVMTEKMDGENSSLYRKYIHARSLDSVDHISQHWLKGLWSNIRYDIPEDWRICGENLYAQHSIQYSNLKSYFQVFSIWNEQNTCLSFDDTIEWCNLLNLITVPVLWRGIFDEKFLKEYKINIEKQEGYVIRLADSFKFEDFNVSIAKWVRKSHVQTEDHWKLQPIIPNKLVIKKSCH